MDAARPAPGRHARVIGRLLVLLSAAFVFAFALVPLYNVLCEATGFNGKTASRGGFGVGGLPAAASAAPRPAVDAGRHIRVEFTGTVMPGLPWEMRPLTVSLDIHPGELQQVSYLVRNTSGRTVTGQAIPSVSPGQAARHFDKIECFCFTRQTLGPGETREMPLAFIVKPEVDRDVATITLSYAFFGIDGEGQTPGAPREER